MRPRNNTSIDGESLQADVMRFMAIIAFCLVAIMALVRDVSPPVAQAPVAEPPVVEQMEEVPELPQLVADAAPISQPAPKPASVSVIPQPQPVAKPRPIERPKTKPVIRTPYPAPEPARVREKIADAAPVPPAPPKPVEPAPQPRPRPEPIKQIAEAPVEELAQELAQEEEGLTLRFDSDRDFLRLISKGEVTLFLFQDGDALKLAPNYSFAATQAPRQLYELMPETIPGAISSAARSSVADLGAYRWGVQMPNRIESRIRSLVAVESSGSLVINRFGEVRHQASAARSSRRNRVEG